MARSETVRKRNVSAQNIVAATSETLETGLETFSCSSAIGSAENRPAAWGFAQEELPAARRREE